jgi:type III pantothenate kinase
MILAIDAGNTRIKWGLRDAGLWVRTVAGFTTDAAALIDAIGTVGAVHRVLVANVAGESVRASIEGTATRLGVAPEFIVSRGAQCGVRSSYEDPAQLGCDRWAALIGARRLYPGACLVVNAGTALTVDALSEEGLFLGGIIAPGIDLMRHSLDRHTAGLRFQPGEVRFFPGNTGDAIMSGAAHAAAGAIERMATFMRESGQDPLRVILGGGSAAFLRPLLGLDTLIVEYLVLEGLAAIAEEGN